MAAGDYDFIIRIIQYLESNFGIRFFITSRDFDVLYRWWEKGIPLRVIQDSIENVVRRRRAKGRQINGFSNFSYEVNKNYRGLMEMKIGETRVREKDDYAEILHFFDHYPPELAELETDFREIFRRVKKHRDISLEAVHEKLLAMFQNDRDLNLKTRFFLQSIARELRKPEMERRYRINFLLHKFKIPEFEIFLQ